MSAGTETGYTPWDKNTELTFDLQTNKGWGFSFDMTGKYPLISKRIFNTLSGLTGYINDPNTSAIEGLVLTVINDKNEEENGAYLVTEVKRYQTNENGFIDKTKDPIGEGKYVKIGTSDNAQKIFEIVTELPNPGEEGKIYLLRKEGTEGGAVYDEYIYKNSDWVKIGEQTLDFDISDTYDKNAIDGKFSEVNDKLNNVYTKDQVYTKNEVDGLLENLPSGGGGLSGQDVKDFIEDALNDINLDEQHVSAVTSETGYFISKVLQNKGQIHVEKTKFSDANIINKNNLNLAIAEVKDYVNTLAFSGITDENIEDIFPSNAELENIKQRVDVLEKYFTALDNEAKIITSKNIDDYAVTKLIEVGQGINISAVDPEKYYFDGKTYYWGDVNINGLDSFSNILIHDKNSEKIDDNIFTIDSN